jgi:hypothetical protein
MIVDSTNTVREGCSEAAAPAISMEVVVESESANGPAKNGKIRCDYGFLGLLRSLRAKTSARSHNMIGRSGCSSIACR